ncbi:MAG: MNIO family bufferin maturase [Dongiaceae bacterium]
MTDTDAQRQRPNQTIPASAGIGLRHPHYRALIDSRPRIGWLEVHSENYFGGGKPLAYLEAARAEYPMSLHGVGLSLGTDGDLDRSHLARIKALIGRIEPDLVSEHLSWSITGGVYLNDLLPLPYTEEALAVLCRHVMETQEFLGREILVENPSTYLQFHHSTIPEWEFVTAVAGRTGCGLLLDVNNVYVSACNHGFDAARYLAAIPADAVAEIHLAGHSVKQVGDATLRIDDHGSRVIDEVWRLYESVIGRLGPVPTLIEWDSNIPEMPVLVAEAVKADEIMRRARGNADVAAA